MRTAEMSDADPTNNRNHYYLFDVMGGNIGLYVDDIAVSGSSLPPSFHSI